MEIENAIARKSIALCAASAVAAACAAAAVAVVSPASAEAATATVQAKNATVSFSKGVAKVKGKGVQVKTTSDSSKRVATVKIKLKGSQAKSSNIWYRVYAKGYGWMGWAKNNAKAGSAVKGAYATKIQTAVIAKGSATQENTDRAAYSSAKGFMGKITGDKATDAKIKKVAKKNGMDLKRCYNWANAMGYASSGVSVTEHGTMSTAHQKAIAKFAFRTGKGDCYGVNVAFSKLATYLGYSSNVYLGSVKRADGTVANAEYGWAVVKTAGEWNIYDAYHGGEYYNVDKNSPVYQQYERS